MWAFETVALIQVGDLSEIAAGTRVDATGMIVAPGFIDIHSHATGSSIEGSSVVRNPNAENYVRQGVTTAMGGQDGSSMLDIDGFLHHLDANPPCYKHRGFRWTRISPGRSGWSG